MIPNPVLIEAPIKTAIDVDLLKKHLRIDNDFEDDLLEILINGATDRVEEFIDMKLIKQKWEIYWDNFITKKKNDPWWDGSREMAISELYQCNNIVPLPFGKVMGDDFSLAFEDSSGAFVDFDQANYKVDGISQQSRIMLKGGGQWPSPASSMNGIKFTAYFGYSDDPEKLPNGIRQALLIIAADLYENKGDEATSESIPKIAQTLLAPWVRIKVG